MSNFNTDISSYSKDDEDVILKLAEQINLKNKENSIEIQQEEYNKKLDKIKFETDRLITFKKLISTAKRTIKEPFNVERRNLDLRETIAMEEIRNLQMEFLGELTAHNDWCKINCPHEFKNDEYGNKSYKCSICKLNFIDQYIE